MQVLQEKLNFLLDKYDVSKEVTLKTEKMAVIDGVVVPLLAHRNLRRLIELKNIVQGGTLVGVSMMRVARIVEKGSDVYEALARELDICRFVLGREIKSIMVMEGGEVLNAIATAEGGVVCTLEIAATLNAVEKPKDKHEIISQRGLACDVVVDAQLQQDSIYVFGQENQKFTDVDFELYGLDAEQVAVVRAAFDAARFGDKDTRIAENAKVLALVDAAKRSAASGEKEVI